MNINLFAVIDKEKNRTSILILIKAIKTISKNNLIRVEIAGEGLSNIWGYALTKEDDNVSFMALKNLNLNPEDYVVRSIEGIPVSIKEDIEVAREMLTTLQTKREAANPNLPYELV